MLIEQRQQTNNTSQRVQAVRNDRNLGLKIVNTPYSNHFKVQGNKIQYIEETNPYYTQLMIDEPVPMTGVFSFKIKVLKSYHRSSALFVGLTIRQEYKNTRTSHYQNNVFTYFGKKALMWPGTINQGHGFSQSDIIEVRIKRAEGRIQYLVNDKIAAYKTSSYLSKLQFVPFIQMHQTKDMVEWLGCQKN